MKGYLSQNIEIIDIIVINDVHQLLKNISAARL